MFLIVLSDVLSKLSEIFTPTVVTYIVLGEAVLILLVLLINIISKIKSDKKKKREEPVEEVSQPEPIKEESKVEKQPVDTTELDEKIKKEKEYIALLEEEKQLLLELEELRKNETLAKEAQNEEYTIIEEVVEDEPSDDDEFQAFVDQIKEAPAPEPQPVEELSKEDNNEEDNSSDIEQVDTVEENNEDSNLESTEENDVVLEQPEAAKEEEVPETPAQNEEDEDEYSKMSNDELNKLLAANGVLEEDEDLLGDEEDEEEEIEELVEEEPEEPEEPENKPKEAGILVPEVSIIDSDGNVKKIKRRFNTKMMFASYQTKEYYNEIKNYLLQYRAKSRYSSRCETYRYKGLVAKVILAGRSIKVCLALDPSFVAQSPKYHFKDVSNKRQYVEVPVMIKVRSERGLKYFKELVDVMMAQRGVSVKRNFTPTNYIPQLIPNGEAILGSLGFSTAYLYDNMNIRSIPSDIPDDLINYLPVIPGTPLEEEESEASVYLDTLCTHFNDGDEITLEKLQEMHIVNKGNTLKIKARGTLDKKLIIYAESFEEDALKMLVCTNCTAVRIARDLE